MIIIRLCASTSWYIRVQWFSWNGSECVTDVSIVLAKWVKILPWFEPDPVCPEPSFRVNFRLVNLFHPLSSTWFRYFGVVNVYSIGFAAEFSGKIKTTRKAYTSAERGKRRTRFYCFIDAITSWTYYQD